MRVKVVSGIHTVDTVITDLVGDTVTVKDIAQIDPAWLNRWWQSNIAFK